MASTDDGNGETTVTIGEGGPAHQPSGAITSESRTVEAFHGVTVGSVIQLKYSKGPASVSVSAQSSILPLITTGVKDGVLNVDLSEGRYEHMKPIVVTVSSPSLDRIDVSGAAQGVATGIDSPNLRVDVSGNSVLNITASCRELASNVSGSAKLTGKLNVEGKSTIEVSGNASADLSGPSGNSSEVQVSGSGSLKLAGLATDTLTLAVSGSGQSELSGSAKSAQITAEGAGQAQLKNLAVDVCQAEASGSGQIYVEAKNALKATASGAANIEYTGHATVDSSTSGAGNVHAG